MTKNYSDLHVLVVEDNLINQLVIQDNLINLGCQVDTASSGQEALDAFEPGKYQCIFLDIQMPEMDGYEVCKRMREEEGGNSHTTIIALTANAMPEDRQICLDAGMDDYIPKPIHGDTLENMLAKHFGAAKE